VNDAYIAKNIFFALFEMWVLFGARKSRYFFI